MEKVCICIGLLLLMTSCYKEVELAEGAANGVFEFADPGREVFELSLSPEVQEFIYSSKDTAYSILSPGLKLVLNNKELVIKDMRVRGRTTLDYKRKSYAVRLELPIFVRGQTGGEVKKLTRFKLISLSMDYTYINNRIAFGILEHGGVMPLFYHFVELRINGNTQGVYLLVEDPEQFFRDQGSEFILRRDYHHGIEDLEYKPGSFNKPQDLYVSTYKDMYKQLPDLKGPALYEALNSRLDLNQYFRKMGIDFFLQNGDYTDEVFFYAMVEQDVIRYKIIPWDYDDIFSKYPHEVGRAWGPGTLFGERSYATHQDVLDVIGQKLIFSIEDDLDYAIAMDSFLYDLYELEFSQLLKTLDADFLGALFDQLEEELTPFYNDEAVIFQSTYDQNPTSFELWQKNMQEKKSLLEVRLESMRKQLTVQDRL